ncbi:hypothetical protein [Acinetobacter populi]|uniref:Uncharacterized protein n=1 Tax=Acinetobacter populi TaxID=1582270 RepID=A0A1Z9YZG8_9GAMM|nr:hypothetical protein [Acinetobacter populi]OUY07577.1 hypothetical protein CAP51_07455 [Acinetobacter populi]
MSEDLTQGPKGYFTSVTFESQLAPLDGQKHRSSPNYDLTQLDQNYDWIFSAPPGVIFSIKEDVVGKDPVVQEHIANGTKATVELKGKKKIYVADPINATEKFKISLSVIQGDKEAD